MDLDDAYIVKKDGIFQKHCVIVNMVNAKKKTIFPSRSVKFHNIRGSDYKMEKTANQISADVTLKIHIFLRFLFFRR